MKWSDIRAPVLEINTIRHNHDDDSYLTDVLHRQFAIYQKPGRTLKQIGSLNTLSVWAENPAFIRNFYFLSRDQQPKGFAQLRETDPGIYRMALIFFVPEARGKGDGLAFYRFMLDRGIAIEADQDQTASAQAVWRKLATMPDVSVAVIDASGEVSKDDPVTAYGSDRRLIARKRSTVKEGPTIIIRNIKTRCSLSNCRESKNSDSASK